MNKPQVPVEVLAALHTAMKALKDAAGTAGGRTASPPQAVRQAAQRGLDLRKKFGRGGTEVGVARARDLSRGANMPEKTVRRMHSFFARHSVDKDAPGWGSTTDPSAGYIAWLLWGGDPGRSWVNGLIRGWDAGRKTTIDGTPITTVQQYALYEGKSLDHCAHDILSDPESPSDLVASAWKHWRTS